MAKAKTRRMKVPSNLRATIAANVALRAEVQFKGKKNLPKEIAAASVGGATNKLHASTVKRIIAAQTSCTLEQLDGLAYALDIAPYQVLMPNLDPTNPQVAQGAAIGEDAFYRIAAQAGKEAAERVLAGAQPVKAKNLR